MSRPFILRCDVISHVPIQLCATSPPGRWFGGCGRPGHRHGVPQASALGGGTQRAVSCAAGDDRDGAGPWPALPPPVMRVAPKKRCPLPEEVAESHGPCMRLGRCRHSAVAAAWPVTPCLPRGGSHETPQRRVASSMRPQDRCVTRVGPCRRVY